MAVNARQQNAPLEILRNVSQQLFHSGQSLSRIKDSALADRLFPSELGLQCAGRSIAWKLFLLHKEPLESQSQTTLLIDTLRDLRKQFSDRLLEKMKAPDGSYEDGFTLPGSMESPRRVQRATVNLEQNNPLSLHAENPWTEWFAMMDLRRTILQDVERTFPDMDFFRIPEVQSQLTNILFLYAVSYPSIGYRQGMHELLAPLYYAVDYDAISDVPASSEDNELLEMCSKPWVTADAWALFDAVMIGVSRWYEWQERPKKITPSSPAAPVEISNAPTGQLEMKPYVSPIVQTCNYVQSTLLRKIDPVLWRHMQSAGIEPQIYGIRWLRLLFTREFSLPDAMKLWDGLFAIDPTFELTPWICVAMLIRIRNSLIPADYTGQLTVLLHYPAAPVHQEPPHHTSLLVRQAIALQMSPTPATGASITLENRNLLNISVDVPEPPPAPRRRVPPGTRDRPGMQGRSNSDDARGRHAKHSSSPSPQGGISDMIAKGLLERGESLGINKTFMNAVSELRRNIPDLGAFANTRSPTNAYTSTVALREEAPPVERPPWEPKTRFEVEREMSGLKARNRQLGDALGWVVDTLLQDESEAADVSELQAEKRQALESLSYVRDLLLNNSVAVEDDRLYSEKEAKRRRQRKEAQERKVVEVPEPPAPPRLPVTDSRPRPVNSATLPRQIRPSRPPNSSPSLPSPSISESSSSSPPTVPKMAPWNYTKSSFSGEGRVSGELPKLPAPTSTSLRGSPEPSRTESRGEPRAKAYHDPLGVS